MDINAFHSGIKVQEEFQPKFCLSYCLLSGKRRHRRGSPDNQSYLDQLMQMGESASHVTWRTKVS